MAADNPVIAMFAWWNEAYEADGFTPEAFGRFFAPELAFIVNGASRGGTLAELAASFQRIRASTVSVRLCLPVIETFGTEDKVFVHYRVEAADSSGAMAEEAFAYAHLDGGLIRRMTVMNRVLPAAP
jgi:hypothetical protein